MALWKQKILRLIVCLLILGLTHRTKAEGTVYVNRGDTVTLRCEYELTSGNGVIYIYENSTGADRQLNDLQSSTTYMLIYVEMSYTIENRTEVYCVVNDYVNVPFHRNRTIYEVNESSGNEVTTTGTTQTTNGLGTGTTTEGGGGGGGNVNLALILGLVIGGGIIGATVVVVLAGIIIFYIVKKEWARTEGAGTGPTASQSNGHPSSSCDSVFVNPKECVGTGNGSLDELVNTFKAPQLHNVPVHRQTTSGVQCTERSEYPVKTVPIPSTTKSHSEKDTLQSSSAEQEDAKSEFDALSESEEPSEMAANTEEETTTRMYISPVQSTRSNVRGRSNKRTIGQDSKHSGEDYVRSHDKPFTTASRYPEEESTGIDGDAGFASKLCYSEQDTQHHILKDKHLVFADHRFVRDSSECSDNDSFDRSILSREHQQHSNSNYHGAFEWPSPEEGKPTELVHIHRHNEDIHKHTGGKSVHIVRDRVVFNTEVNESIPNGSIVDPSDPPKQLHDDTESINYQQPIDTEHFQVHVQEPANTITNSPLLDPELHLPASELLNPHFTAKTIYNSTPKEPTSEVSSPVTRQYTKADQCSTLTESPPKVSDPPATEHFSHSPTTTQPPSSSDTLLPKVCVKRDTKKSSRQTNSLTNPTTTKLFRCLESIKLDVQVEPPKHHLNTLQMVIFVIIYFMLSPFMNYLELLMT